MDKSYYVAVRDRLAARGEEYSREWYDGNGMPYPPSGIGSDNSMAPWLTWCDDCNAWHLHHQHDTVEGDEE